MKQVLTSLAFIGATLSLNAQTQILNYGFETADQLPGVVDTVNFYQDWKDGGGTISYTGSPAYEGEYAFSLSSPAGVGKANRWERVLRFTKLALKENTSYRVSFYARATDDAEIDVAIMRGELNADMPLLCAPSNSNENYVQQVTAVTGFSAGEYVRKSVVFWSPSLDIQKEWFSSFKSEGELPEDVFLRLSLVSEGDYLLDNVVVEEATLAGVTFNGDAIKVDFGYPTNAADLAAAAGGTAIVDGSHFSLVLDGEAVTPESVELKSDGHVYLFLGEDYYLTEESKLTISYKGTIEGFNYATSVAPESWTNPNRSVLPFENEVATLDVLLDAVSVAYEEAELVATNPITGSFEMPETTNEFTFTYNKEVYTGEDSPEGAPVAVLANATGWNETLAVKAGQESLSTSVTFVRTATEPLVKGEYTVTVENITNAKGVAKISADELTFEVGKVSVSETTYTLVADLLIPDTVANKIPYGWTVNNEGEIREGGSAQGSGPRTFNFANSTVAAGLYIRTTAADTEGSATYGDQEDYRLTIPAGEVEFRSIYLAWKGSGFTHKVEIFDADDQSLVVEKSTPVERGCEGNTSNQEFLKMPIRFTSDGGNYIVKFHVMPTGGYTELIIGGAQIYTYVETEGDKSDSDIVFEETWSSTAANIVPAAGTGWDLYDADVLLEKGSSGSGKSSRIMKLSATTNLTSAYYSRMMGGDGSNYYAIYGNGGTYQEGEETKEEPTLTLQAGKHQFTYYAINWKSDEQKINFIVMDENDEVVFTRTDAIFGNLNGNTGATAEATKIQYNAQIPADGKYKLKIWMTSECLVGNIQIMKVGSMAVYYKTLLKTAIDQAKAELETASDPLFAGTTYNELAAAIEAYSNHDFHAPVQYTDAIAHLEALVKKMAARRAQVTTYNQIVLDIPTLLASVEGTKYVGLEAYTALGEAYAKYETVSSLDLEDDALIEANTTLVDGYNLLNNMVNEGVALLTAQIANAAAQIAVLDEEVDLESEVLLAAGNALTDDQELMGQLKKMLTAAVYRACVNGDPFNVFDEEYQQYTADSLDLTCYIQNADLYTTSQKRDNITPEEATDIFPGWTVNVIKGNIGVGFGWTSFAGSATHPITDAFLLASWGPEVDMTQEVNTIPVGVYSISAGTEDSGDRLEGDSAFVKSFFRYVTPTKSDTLPFSNVNRGEYYDLSRTIHPNVTLDATDEAGVYASVMYGAYTRTYQSINAVDQFKLHMTAKAEGFDYAAALEKVKNDIATGIANVQIPAGTPKMVKYFNLDGTQVAQPNGVCIQISTYDNGMMTVKKVFVK